MFSATKYVRSFRLTKFHGEILLRMAAGDFIQAWPSGRVILKTSDPYARSSIQLAVLTFTSLDDKGMIWRDVEREREAVGEIYTLTETGEEVAELLIKGIVTASALISRQRKSKLKS